MQSVRPYLRLAGAVALIMTGGRFEPARAQTPAAKPKAAPAAQAATPVPAKKLVETNCAACHGVDGNTTSDPLYPKLADQKATYIRLQLHAFKSGARKSDIMSAPAQALTDAQIDELARYYSDQPLKPDKVEDKPLAAIGERIFHQPARGAAACVACHSRGGPGPGFGPGGMMGGAPGMGHGMAGGGPGGMMEGGMGMMANNAAVPNLYGQHAAYTLQQLDAFAHGKRGGTVMGPISAALSPHDRQAVADYLAGAR